MTAEEVLEKLRVLDVAVEVAGDKLRLSPPEAISPELLEAIREHKPKLLTLLSRDKGGQADKSADDELGLEREAIQAEASISLNGGTEPSRWSRLADSGLHHNDVSTHAEVIFLFACELIADPSQAREDCQALPAMWAYYAPHWRERLPQEAFEELGRKYRLRLADPGLQEEARPPLGPKPLRPLVLNAEGTGCKECGGAEYWVAKGGARFCLSCCPAPYRDAIALGVVRPAQEENARRPSMRRGKGRRSA